MNDEVKTNIDMANKDHIILSCNTLGTPVLEARHNLQMPSLTLTEDNIECVDEKIKHYNNCEDSSEHVQSSEYVNYYDNESYVLEQLKTEFSEDVLPQSDCSVNSQIHSENKELLKLVTKTEINDENTEDGLSLNITEENDYQFIVKTEGLEEQKEAQCNFYHKALKNGFNLLQNSNKPVEIDKPVDNGITELHHCKYCGNGFDNYNNMLAHISNDHKQEQLKCDICGKQFKKAGNLNRHILAFHKLDKPLEPMTENCMNCRVNVQHKFSLNNHSTLSCSGKEDGQKESENKVTRSNTNDDNYGTMLKCRCGKEFRSPLHLQRHERLIHRGNVQNTTNVKFQCDNCKIFIKTKSSLLAHIKRRHYDYGKRFDCWCGKQFNSPLHLRDHEKRIHRRNVQNINNRKFQCDYCNIFFKTKMYLSVHIKRVHYDYGKRFDCWCGKQFRSPLHLRQHERDIHKGNVKKTTNDKLQCDYCKIFIKTKSNLLAHIKRRHYDYGKQFDCCCGKQFNSPIHLREHEKRIHRRNVQNINNRNFQCDYCKTFIKRKSNLLLHIKRLHYDYGKRFDCWCGKQFRSPLHLYEHKSISHQRSVQNINNGKFQCDYCNIFFKTKMYLSVHIKRVHYDYGKRFDCWCGKQFRSPIHLRDHKRMIHQRDVQNINNGKFQCDYCKIFFITKMYLSLHIKRVHYDYGKRFDCWCGKQFRSPIHLRSHERMIHQRDVQNINNDKFQCDYCKIFFKTKVYLSVHIKRFHYDYGKRFDCWCGKQFRSPIQLYEHKRMIHQRGV